MGFMFLGFLGAYSLGFFYGSVLIKHHTINPVTQEAYNAGSVMTVFFCILIGSSSLGQLGPQITAIATARV